MLKQNDLSRRRRLAGGSALMVLCAATGVAAWASQPPQVRVAAAPAVVAAVSPAIAPALPASMPRPPAALRPAEAVASDPAADAAEIARLGRLVQAAREPEARAIQVAALDPPPGPRGGQPVLAGPPPGPPPPPGEAPPASLDRPWEPNSVINPNALKTVEGVVNAVKWTYPSSEIWIRESESGQMVVVNTETTAALAAAGINRQTLRPGTAITIKGYPAKNGSRLYADPAEIVAGGKLATIAATPGLPQKISRRLEICGDLQVQSILPAGAATDPKAAGAAIAAWRAQCDAKMAAAGG